MSNQANIGNLYQLIFEGLTDDSPVALQRLKGVFIADLELSVPEVQSILNNATSHICTSDNYDDLFSKQLKLSSAGAKVNLVVLAEEEQEAINDQTDDPTIQADNEPEQIVAANEVEEQELEFELELDIDQPVKKKREKVHVVSENLSLDDTLRELGLDTDTAAKVEDDIKALNVEQQADNKLQPLFDLQEPLAINEGESTTLSELQQVKNLDDMPLFDLVRDSSKQQIDEAFNSNNRTGLFDDLTLQEVPETLQLVEELVTVNEEEENKELNEQEYSNTSKPPVTSDEPANIDFALDFETENANEIINNTARDEIVKPLSIEQNLDFSDLQLLESEVPIVEQGFSTEVVASPVVLQAEITSLKPSAEIELPAVNSSTSANSQSFNESDNSQNTPTTTKDRVRLQTKKNHKIKSIAWDTIIPIIVGAIILGIGNYYYFTGLEQEHFVVPDKAKKASLVESKNLKQKNMQSSKTSLGQINALAQSNWVLSDVIPQEFTVVADLQENGTEFLLGKVEIKTTRPQALTDQERVQKKPERPWLSKITIGNVKVNADANGRMELGTQALAYIVSDRNSQRFIANARISGVFDSVHKQITLSIHVGNAAYLEQPGVSIAKQVNNEFSYQLLAKLIFKKPEVSGLQQ